MDEELVKLHDGELPPHETARVEAELAKDVYRTVVLAEIAQLDHVAGAALRQLAPTAERVERDKAELKAMYRRHENRRRRLRLVGLGMLAGAAAAVLGFLVHIRHAAIVGTVQLADPKQNAEQGAEQPLRLRSAVGSRESDAYISVTDVATMILESGGLLRVGDRASIFKLVTGRLAVETTVETRIRVGAAPYTLDVGADSSAVITVTDNTLIIEQSRGSAVLGGPTRAQTIEAPASVRIPLTVDPLAQD